MDGDGDGDVERGWIMDAGGVARRTCPSRDGDPDSGGSLKNHEEWLWLPSAALEKWEPESHTRTTRSHRGHD